MSWVRCFKTVSDAPWNSRIKIGSRFTLRCETPNRNRSLMHLKAQRFGVVRIVLKMRVGVSQVELPESPAPPGFVVRDADMFRRC